MMAFLRLIRFPNLLIVALTQILLQYGLIIPSCYWSQVSPTLDTFHFALLCLATILVASGGYIINDLMDYEIDQINKPDKLIIKQHISISTAQWLYRSINVIGFIISSYIAYYIDQWLAIALYPLAAFALWAYSKKWKKSNLIGNLVVSLFCAGVAGIVLFAEAKSLHEIQSTIPEFYEMLHYFLWSYIGFAFISTMYREIIKDIEDVEGDRANGARTLPIVWGISVAKGFAFVFGTLLILLVVMWISGLDPQHPILIWAYTLAGIVLPTMYSLYGLVKAKDKIDYHKLSRIAKYIMLSGLLFLVLYMLDFILK